MPKEAADLLEELLTAKDSLQVRKKLRVHARNPRPKPLSLEVKIDRSVHKTPEVDCDSSAYFRYNSKFNVFIPLQPSTSRSLTNIYNHAKVSSYIFVGVPSCAMCYQVQAVRADGVFTLLPMPMAADPTLPYIYKKLLSVTFASVRMLLGQLEATYAVYTAMPSVYDLPQIEHIVKEVETAMNHDPSLAHGLAWVVSEKLDAMYGKED